MKRTFVVFLTLLLVLVSTATADASRRPPTVRLPVYNPGSPIELEVKIRNSGRNPVEYDLSISYGGVWWGGGAGPSTAVYGTQYWVECSDGCTEWWNGTVPPYGTETITIPLTTNPNWRGTYPRAVLVTGSVDGNEFNISATAKTK